jgi:hypothetical protein
MLLDEITPASEMQMSAWLLRDVSARSISLDNHVC